MLPSRVLFAIALIGPCVTGTEPVAGTITGTWGGDNAGLIASDSTAHVHIGCTLGDAQGPLQTDTSGKFDVAGQFNVDAYPVDRGILHPARFTGQVTGRTMVLTVTLTDTARQLGPVTLTYGQEPHMQICPICRVPRPRRNGGTGGEPSPAMGPAAREEPHMIQYLYDAGGNAVGFLSGRYLYLLSGKPIGQLSGTHVYTLSGSYVGELDHDMVVDKHLGNPGSIGNAGDPGGPGNPGNPGNRGRVSYGYADIFHKLMT